MPKAKPRSVPNTATSAPPDLGLPRYHASTWARIVRIHALACEKRRFNCTDLMREFEADEDAVRGTLRQMRDDLRAPLDFDPRRNTYHYTREWPHLPHIILTPDEKHVLKLICQLVPHRKDGAVGRVLQSVLEKVEWISGGDGSTLGGTADEMVLSAAVLGAAEQRHLPQIQQAIDECRELEIGYRKPGAATPERHTIQPHLLRFIRHQWILLTHDLTRRGELRTFVLRRIVDAKPTDRGFTRPADFDPQRILDGNFGAYTGTEDHRIRLLLRGAAAVDATELPWHKSQRHTTRPDGTVELTLRLNNLVDIKHEILRWGELAEVLEPAPLRDAVRDSLRAAAEQY